MGNVSRQDFLFIIFVAVQHRSFIYLEKMVQSEKADIILCHVTGKKGLSDKKKIKKKRWGVGGFLCKHISDDITEGNIF